MSTLRDMLGLPKKTMSKQAFIERLKCDSVPFELIDVTMTVIHRLTDEYHDKDRHYDSKHEIGARSMKALRDFRFHHHLSEQECLHWYEDHKQVFDATFERLSRRYGEVAVDELTEHIEHWHNDARMVSFIVSSMIAIVVFDSRMYKNRIGEW